MKRLRNILTVILLALGMLLPATVRAENTVDVKAYRRFLRMAHHDVGRNSRYDSFAGNSA